MPIRLEQLAAQTYTVREHLKTPAEVARSLRTLREIGFLAVEIAAIDAVAPSDLAALLQDQGLLCCAVHESPNEILSRPEAVIERVGALGCRYCVYPYPAGIHLETEVDARMLAGRLEKAGRAFANAGLVLAYHNHHVEFRRFGGRTFLEILYHETSPEALQAELDTYWVQYGGGDPVDWCGRMKDRLPLLHLKDYAIDHEHKPAFAEVGSGNLPWPRILPTAEAAGCQWYVVEQDVCPGDPFDSLRRSFEFLNGHFVQ